MDPSPPAPRGRATARNPENRFEGRRLDPEGPPPEKVDTQYVDDRARSVISRNRSPDVPFDASLNPYRGCEHGCIYCYARPTHEYLGLSAGLDFESRIFVKRDAPELLRRELASPRWRPQPLALSGVTDAYQPIERRLGVTRACLEVLAEARNPVWIVTKSALVRRDADLLAELARHRAVSVAFSIPTLDPQISSRMEPRAAHPRGRLEAMATLAAAGVPCGVLTSPVVPGLTDHEQPRILEAAAEAGAGFASFLLLRLPGAVAGLFAGWLEECFPERRERVLGRVRDLRGGRLNDPRFGTRMRGEGPIAEGIAALFESARRRHGLARSGPRLSTDAFRRPGGQLELFGGAG